MQDRDVDGKISLNVTGTGFDHYNWLYRGDDKSLTRPTSRYVLFDGENISFDAGLVVYIYIYI